MLYTSLADDPPLNYDAIWKPEDLPSSPMSRPAHFLYSMSDSHLLAIYLAYLLVHVMYWYLGCCLITNIVVLVGNGKGLPLWVPYLFGLTTVVFILVILPFMSWAQHTQLEQASYSGIVWNPLV